MLSCKEATHVMSAAHERELGLRERIALRLHLLMCKGCTNYNHQLSLIRKACAELETQGKEERK